jgi:hypothetical protein
MKFRTEVPIDKLNHDITHDERIVAFGSCFVENIGVKLEKLNFKIDINPFGIIFNPYSIAKVLNRGLEKRFKLDKECDVLECNGIFKSYDYHSKFNAKSYNDFINKTDHTYEKISSQLKNNDYLFLTFGTAWIYRLIESNQVVANCQKVPQSNFTKELLDLNELTDIYLKIFKRLVSVNPKLKIVLTVSPVRHIKDGIVENNQSKSILLLLCKALSDDFKHNVVYFPSYEIQMDDLRDYRFYNSDLVHPNQMAVDYIFEKFSNAFFSDNTKCLNSKIKKLNKLESHRFLNATEKEKQKHHHKIESLRHEINQGG